MRPISARRTAILVLIAAALLRAQEPDRAVDYRLQPGKEPGSFAVEIVLPAVEGGDHRLSLPVWKPGSYRLGNWIESVHDVEAVDAKGEPLKVEAESARSWRIASGGAAGVRFRYRSRSAKNMTRWICCEGPATFCYLEGGLDRPCRLSIDLPEGWTVATGLAAGTTPGTFQAPDYDTFADCPIELGALTVDSFEVDGVPHFISYNLKPGFDRERMKSVSSDIVRTAAAIFGKLPYASYHFMWQLQQEQDFFGGLEHLNSTTLQLPMFVLRGGLADQADLVAHEYFHLWNVKRIRPRPLGPFDYSQPVRVRGLWFSEGVTDYYAGVICVRAGIWPAKRWLGDVAQALNGLRNNPAFGRESVEEASLATWDRSFEAPSGLDYYGTGKVLGLILDIEIRQATQGAKSLDDLMRLLLDRFGLPRPGFTDAELRQAFSEVAGVDLTDFFDRYVSGREDPPFEAAMAHAGIKITDLGGSRADGRELAKPFESLRLESREVEGLEVWEVVEAPEGQPLRAGDRVRRVAGRSLSAGRGEASPLVTALLRATRGRRAPETVSIEYTREGKDESIDLPVPQRRFHDYRLEIDPEAKDEGVLKIRDALVKPRPLPEAGPEPAGTKKL